MRPARKSRFSDSMASKPALTWIEETLQMESWAAQRTVAAEADGKGGLHRLDSYLPSDFHS
jgi:hypothetical protein